MISLISKAVALFFRTKDIFKNVIRSIICFSDLPGVLWQHNKLWFLSLFSRKSIASLSMIWIQCASEKGQGMWQGEL